MKQRDGDGWKRRLVVARWRQAEGGGGGLAVQMMRRARASGRGTRHEAGGARA